jgi:hypothetical protein
VHFNGDKDDRKMAALYLLYGLIKSAYEALFDLQYAFDRWVPSKEEKKEIGKKNIAFFWRKHLKQKRKRKELYNEAVKTAKVSHYESSIRD